jgi:hypothetical protein
MAVLLAMAPMLAVAQEDIVQHFEVPDGEYTGTDVFRADDLWNEYIVHVERGHDLHYSFEVIGQGTITVSLMPGKNPTIYGDYYERFSTSEPRTSYSAVFPAVVGFDRDYSIVVNSSYPGDVQYRVTISTEPAETPDYTLYYILIILGFVALVVFSYKLVVWQENQEKKSRNGERRKRSGRRKR